MIITVEKLGTAGRNFSAGYQPSVRTQSIPDYVLNKSLIAMDIPYTVSDYGYDILYVFPTENTPNNINLIFAELLILADELNTRIEITHD